MSDKNKGGEQPVRVTCHTAEHCDLDKLEPLQGTLKKRTSKDLDHIETSILKFGIAFPFFYADVDGHRYILDGHGRKQALLRMRERGAILPQMPVVRVEAKSVDEAKQLLLRCESRYGILDAEGFKEFIGGLDMNFEELSGFDDLKDIDLSGNSEKFDHEKKVASIKIGDYTVKMTETEYEQLKNKLSEYMSYNLVQEGFIANLLGIENNVTRGLFFLSDTINDMIPADYNPRRCSDENIAVLCESISILGMLRPIIINGKNKTIIAGHQRVKALLKIGIDKAPVFKTKAVGKEYETRINQIHNAIEDEDTAPLCVPVSVVPGFSYVRMSIKPVKTIKALNYIDIIMKCGNIDGAIASMDGTVIKGHDYLYACQMLHVPARIYYLENSQKKEAFRLLFRKYGEFNYEGKDTHSFQQHKAQLSRLGKKQKSKSFISQLYMKMFETENLNGKSILDFGAGKCAYAENLIEKGIDILPIEFFRMKNGSVDYAWTHNQIDKLIEKIKTKGLFDIVICDSVLNSVVNEQAEIDVLRSIATFLSQDGKAYISGRCIESAHTVKSSKSTIYELDKNNFTMNMRNGEWFAQHFHSKSGVTRVFDDNFLSVKELFYDGKTWMALAVKNNNFSFEKCKNSIDREFNLMYNKTASYNRGRDVLEALECVYG